MSYLSNPSLSGKDYNGSNNHINRGIFEDNKSRPIFFSESIFFDNTSVTCDNNSETCDNNRLTFFLAAHPH